MGLISKKKKKEKKKKKPPRVCKINLESPLYALQEYSRKEDNQK